MADVDNCDESVQLDGRVVTTLRCQRERLYKKLKYCFDDSAWKEANVTFYEVYKVSDEGEKKG
jgi:hypothetical protein